MAFDNPQHFNIYRFFIKLLALLICCFFLVSCNKKAIQVSVTPENNVKAAENAVNINTASAEELEKLPNVGKKLARGIVEHREKYGDFRKPAHLILVPGISDKRFRQMQELIKIE
jgi:competence ComEA-like helix-hairpin-helix protein